MIKFKKVGLLALLAVLSVGVAQAEPSQESAQAHKQNWQSMSQAEKQAKAQDMHAQAAEKRTQWQSLSAEEKQAKAAGARAMMQQKRSAR